MLCGLAGDGEPHLGAELGASPRAEAGAGPVPDVTTTELPLPDGDRIVQIDSWDVKANEAEEQALQVSSQRGRFTPAAQ